MQHVDSDNNSSDYEAIFQDDFTDIDSSSDIEEILNSDSDEENKLLYLTKMGFSEAEALITMEVCGPDSSITELTDFICANQMAKATDALLMVLEACDDEPSLSVHKYILDECRKWNLVWVGKNKVAPLEPDEVEMLIGFPKNHTRGGGSARDMFPGGINVLSLFSGISDAKVAFYCLGIPLKTNVQELNDDRLEQLMSRFGGFDLVVGSIPCNNLNGSTKHHQDGLEDFCWCIYLQ
ncbi:Detected protein of confused Function [Hibiscus syriacus]|uniref:Detected protein of confused Function n=1 Tax=Hibiscus syriacus TaxID=106335 RepID=A0A6A3CRV7_HIBSY|nr:Detected protein of confused Function [Hibiscus syriacus]